MKGIQLRQEIEQYFEVVPSRCNGDEIAIICPTPGCGDASGNRSVNLKTGKTSCWRCNSGGSFVHWARRLGYEISEESIGELSVSETENMLNEMDRRERVFTPVISDVKLPRGFTEIKKEPDVVYSRLIAKMARRKNLTRKDFELAGVGFTSEDPVWEPYAIFPIVEWGHVVYFQGRTYTDVPGESTKRFPNKTRCPLGSRYWVYNIDEVREKKPKIVIVVESILNVLSLKSKIREVGADGVVPVAVFKHAISKEQMKKLMAFKFVEEFAMAFDPDAMKDSLKIASEKSGTRKFSYLTLPEGIDCNDDVDLAWRQFKKRKNVDRPLVELEQLFDSL